MNIIRNDATTWTIVAIGVVGALFFAVGEIFQWPAASANGAIILVSLVWLAFAILVVARELVLLVGVLPGTAAVFAVWIPVAFEGAQHPEFVVLLPLPLVAAFLLLWAPVGWLAVRFTQRWRERKVLGPATETAAMSWLVLPWLLATIAFPILLEQDNETIAAFAAIGVGLLWSKLLSDPFARFVRAIFRECGDRELGGKGDNTRCAGCPGCER